MTELDVIRVDKLTYWLHDKIDEEVSCYEDLEMVEGERNDFHRGKVRALEEILEALK